MITVTTLHDIQYYYNRIWFDGDSALGSLRRNAKWRRHNLAAGLAG